MKNQFDIKKSARAAAEVSMDANAKTPLEQDQLALAKFLESGEESLDYSVWKQFFQAELRNIAQLTAQKAPSANATPPMIVPSPSKPANS